MPRHLHPVLAATALVLVTGAGLVGCGSGDGSGAAGASGTLQVVDATVDRPLNPDVSAARLVVDNRSAQADELESVTSPVSDAVSVHRTVDDDGRSSMTDVDRLAIPPRSKVTFEPGGLHVMLDDLNTTLDAGDVVPLTLTFEHAGAITVDAVVTEPGGAPEEHDHD